MGPIDPQTTDDVLVAMVAEGSASAFAEIDRRYRPLLISRVAPIVGADEAEDVAQDALMKAQVELVAGARPNAFGSWLLAIAHNRAVDIIRMRRDAPGFLASHTPTTEETAERNEQLRDVVDELHRLPESQKAALIAHSFEGKAYAEIAAEQGTSTGAVKMAVYRGRARLRDRFSVFTPLPLLLLIKRLPGRVREAGPTAGAATAGAVAVASVALASGLGSWGGGGGAETGHATMAASGESAPREPGAPTTPGDGNGARDRKARAGSGTPASRASASAPAAPAPVDQADATTGPPTPALQPQPEPATAPEPEPSDTPQAGSNAGQGPAQPPVSGATPIETGPAPIETGPAPIALPDEPVPSTDTPPQPVVPPSEPTGCGGLIPCVLDLVGGLLGPRAP